jgi:hypothetical protein
VGFPNRIPADTIPLREGGFGQTNKTAETCSLQQMNRTAYVRHLDTDVRYRVTFVTKQGEVLEFVVQLEVAVGAQWKPVIRFDTAHGFAHCDHYQPDGTVQKHQTLPARSYDQALTYATRIVLTHWEDLAAAFREKAP